MSVVSGARFCHRKGPLVPYCCPLPSPVRTNVGALARALLASVAIVASLGGCSHDRALAPAPRASAPDRAPRTAEIEAPKQMETSTPYHARLTRGAELYLPPWFALKSGQYDLVVHFHGENRWQVANVERSKLNAAIVSVNVGGLGTEHYSNAFKSPDAFDRLLAEVQAELVKSTHAEAGGQPPRLKRLALSAWSAGFSSISRVMTEAMAQRIDAVILADGFFTSFSNTKKRTVNAQGLEKWRKFADGARKDDKLFAITHTTIPTGSYPSVQECVAKLLEMMDLTKTEAVATGPRDMRQFYTVDEGSFHIRGFEGTQASDHVKQLHAMGETMYPYLKARWDKQDADATKHAER